jgi:hypothetical protein
LRRRANRLELGNVRADRGLVEVSSRVLIDDGYVFSGALLPEPDRVLGDLLHYLAHVGIHRFDVARVFDGQPVSERLPHLLREPVAHVSPHRIDRVDLSVADGEIPVVVGVRTEPDLVGPEGVHVEGATEDDFVVRVALLLAVVDRLLVADGPRVGDSEAELLRRVQALTGDIVRDQVVVGQIGECSVGVEAAVRIEEAPGNLDGLAVYRVLRRADVLVDAEPAPATEAATTAATTEAATARVTRRRLRVWASRLRRPSAAWRVSTGMALVSSRRTERRVRPRSSSRPVIANLPVLGPERRSRARRGS